MIIYQAIKNFILAIVVCRKYGLGYNPFCLFSNSAYNYIYKYIIINPFHPEFNSILFHEVGHHIHNKLVDYNTFFDLKPNSMKISAYDQEYDFNKVIESESFASRFAIKTGKADKNALIGSFNSYARMPFQHDFELTSKPFFMSYVDCVAKYSLRITRP